MDVAESEGLKTKWSASDSILTLYSVDADNRFSAEILYRKMMRVAALFEQDLTG
jgi:hypothetical protein